MAALTFPPGVECEVIAADGNTTADFIGVAPLLQHAGAGRGASAQLQLDTPILVRQSELIGVRVPNLSVTGLSTFTFFFGVLGKRVTSGQ